MGHENVLAKADEKKKRTSFKTHQAPVNTNPPEPEHSNGSTKCNATTGDHCRCSNIQSR
jgi:phage terminase large subunit-like protein